MGGESIVVRRGEHGWQAGDEQAADLTSAMADLLAVIHSLWITMG
jgi:hypothetical protein